MTKIIYKGFEIEDGPYYTKWSKYQYIHQDYDGDEDNRIGFGSTVEECKEEIDERFYE